MFIFVCMRKRVGTMRLWDGDWWRCVHRSAWIGDTVRVWSQLKWCAERSASHHIMWWILLNHLPILTHLIILEGKTSKTILAISISKHIIVLVLLHNHCLPMIREKVIWKYETFEWLIMLNEHISFFSYDMQDCNIFKC